MNKIELLSPAGSFDALKAAVQNGANAVYLGGQKFNARKTAGNFTNDELEKALYYCHVRDTKVHLAVNTLVNENELFEAVEFIYQADQMGVDAVILQDLGLASKVIGKISTQIHASTQMTIHNLAGVLQLKELGFNRIILSRELSLDEIRRICQENLIDIEVFGHGALCISYSGQCLMSSFIGNRSGNRGTCAQPCRMKYQLLKNGNSLTQKETHLLSPADLCTLPYLYELISTGIKSIKIEGRLKSPEYVALVTKIYRQAIDRIPEFGRIEVPEDDINDLAVMFGRGNFCSGNQLNKITCNSITFDNPGRAGIEAGIMVKSPKKIPAPISLYDIEVKLKCPISKNDGITFSGDKDAGGIINVIKLDGNVIENAQVGQLVTLRVAGKVPVDLPPLMLYKTFDASIMEMCQNTFLKDKDIRRIDINGHFTAKKGDKPNLKVSDNRGNIISIVSQINTVQAINKPLDDQTIKKQLMKTGDTPYNFSKITIDIDNDIILPLSVINEMRREALMQLTEKRSERILPLAKISENISIFYNEKSSSKGNFDISLSFLTEEAFISCLNICDEVARVYIPILTLVSEKFRSFLRELNRNYEIYTSMPLVSKGRTEIILESLFKHANELNLDGISASNVGDFKMIKDMKISGEIGLNVFNSATGLHYNYLGAERLTVSPELTIEQICDLIRSCPSVNIDAILYGRIPVMKSEYCPVGAIEGGFTNSKPCNKICAKKGKYALKDKFNDIFPIICDSIDCRSTILDRRPIFLDNINSLQKLRNAGLSGLRLNIYDESPELVGSLVKFYNSLQHDSILDTIDNYKGHFYKGV